MERAATRHLSVRHRRAGLPQWVKGRGETKCVGTAMAPAVMLARIDPWEWAMAERPSDRELVLLPTGWWGGSEGEGG